MIQLIRLTVSHLAAIGHVDIELGPGLNVLYGPNDLGKSTMAESIRLALLLPHSSNYADVYLPWRGDADPVVELTFTTGPQRIHRVRKQFGRARSSLLQESRNGVEFETVESGRAVDGALRRLLAWGIPEPGGAERTHGLPKSFLATALLSTQREVSAILERDLKDDRTGTGKDQIAKALETFAQNPKFLALLQQTQERRDAAYTENGRKRTGQGTVFKEAADRVNEAREEAARWRRVVSDAEGAIEKLRQLGGQRDRIHERLASAKAALTRLEELAEQGAKRAAAQELLRAAEAEMQRIRNLGRDVEASERNFALLGRQVTELTQAHDAAKKQHQGARASLAAEQAALRAEESGPAANDVEAHARRSEIAGSMRGLEPRIAGLLQAKTLAQVVVEQERLWKAQEAAAALAARTLAKAQEEEREGVDGLSHGLQLEKMLAVLSADQQVLRAREQVLLKEQLQARQTKAIRERDRLAIERAGMVVPPAQLLGPMRRLAQDLARARGAMEVGIVTTVVPHRAIELTLRKDGGPSETFSTAEPRELEAAAEQEIVIAGIATLQVKGGSRAVQEQAARLEVEWDRTVSPHLEAAGVSDLEALEGMIAAAQQIDTFLRTQQDIVATLQPQIDSLVGAAIGLEQAEQAAAASHAAMGDADQAALQAELAGFGLQAVARVRSLRDQSSAALESARTRRGQAAQDSAIASDRVGQLREQVEAARRKRDEAHAVYPQGIDASLAAAESELAALKAEDQAITTKQAARVRDAAERTKGLQAALKRSVDREKAAAAAEDAANRQRENAIAEVAREEGSLRELRKQRDAANLALAEDGLQQKQLQLQLLPVPERTVTDAEVAAARSTVHGLDAELTRLGKDIERAHGALEQTGGSVARERLSDAEEALLIAEQREREIEAEFEGWKLLLETMKEADASQASNLGLALTPAVADRFSELTRRRYGPVKLGAGLATEGIFAGGDERSTSLLSVGTRDQLSTLFRLALAEYLEAAVVLDDQLVQSDELRMQWFRTLLYEKARQFQIIVLTCRPEDYLPSLVPDGAADFVDLEDHPVRAINLGRALRRHE